VYLVYALRRALMGSVAHNPPSRFLEDIPSHLTALPGVRVGGAAAAIAEHVPVRGRTGPSPSMPALKAGDHVSHAAFGEGIVVSCLPSSGDHEVTVAFKGGAGVKRLLLSLAPLQKLS
jgi:DNA helicase-2/ATP-dependent DNA helicase PcrA